MTHTALPYLSAPISKLPIELLISVFQSSIDEELSNALLEPFNPYQRPTPFILRVSQVCRVWRDIVRNAASLWSSLPFYDSYGARWINQCLTLSKSSPLHVKLYSGLRIRNAPPSNIDILIGQAHRIQTLHGATHSSTIAADFQLLLEQPMPELKTLILTYGYKSWSLADSVAASFPFLLRAGAPSLTTFISYKCNVDLSSAMFSRLRELEIHNIPPPFHPTVSQWLEILQNMPLLEKLSITESITFGPAHIEPTMPCLRIFHYAGDFVGFVLLSQLIVLHLEELGISVLCGPPQNRDISSGVIRQAVCRSFRDDSLAGCTLGIYLQLHRLSFQTLPTSPGIRVAKDYVHTFVDLMWNPDCHPPADISLVTDAIFPNFQRLSTIITRIDILASTPRFSVNYSQVFVSLRSFLTQLSQVHHWITYTACDVCSLSFCFLGDLHTMTEKDLTFPLLDTLTLKTTPRGELNWLKQFFACRSRLGKPVRVLRIPEADIVGAEFRDLGCIIEGIEKDLPIFDEYSKLIPNK